LSITGITENLKPFLCRATIALAEKNPIAEPEKASMAQWSLSLIRASFSQERLQYLEEPSKIVYQTKEGTDEEVFDALQWFAAIACR